MALNLAMGAGGCSPYAAAGISYSSPFSPKTGCFFSGNIPATLLREALGIAEVVYFTIFTATRKEDSLMDTQQTLEGQFGWSLEEIQRVTGGEWVNPPKKDCRISQLAILPDEVTEPEHTLFIAMDAPTWRLGSNNAGVEALWDDTHATLENIPRLLGACIVQRPVLKLPDSIPQLLVKNSYDCLIRLSAAARDAYAGKIVGITGTVGKSSTKAMLAHLLQQERTVVTTPGNHNTRTGVRRVLATLKTEPDYCILEIAQSALWMYHGTGICKKEVRPHIGVITEIGVGQTTVTKTTRDTATYKINICNGIQPGGYAVLNGNMAELDFIVEGVKKFGATPVLYGDSPAFASYMISRESTSNGSMIRACILGEEVSYCLPVLGKAMAHNSLAALTTATLLGENVRKSASFLKAYTTCPNVLEPYEVNTGSGTITIIDDSHNAEVQSTIAAFETVRELAKGERRQIAMLANIINLAEFSPKIHASLAQPFLEHGFDKVFGYGEDMEYMLAGLPETAVGGLFYSVETLLDGVTRYVRDGDIILIKGDRRDNDFGRCRRRLIRKLQERLSPLLQEDGAGALLFDVRPGALKAQLGKVNARAEEGLGHVLLIYYTLTLLSEGVVSIDDVVTPGDVPEEARRYPGALGLSTGVAVTVSQLLSSIILTGAPDASLVLARHFSAVLGKNTTAQLDAIARAAGLNENVIHNISGRYKESAPQYYTLEDIGRLGRLFGALPERALALLGVDAVAWNGRKLTRASRLPILPGVSTALCFGHGQCSAFILGEHAGRTVQVCVCNAATQFECDSMGAQLLQGTGPGAASRKDEKVKIAARTEIITFCGDTYFGEWYTKHRLSDGERDALSEYGYTHSFERVAPFLKQSDFNILNFEAVLASEDCPPAYPENTYNLIGNPVESVNELCRRGVHAVSLANNHTMDFGEEGLRSTLEVFHRAGIHTFGAGLSETEACRGLHCLLGDRRVIVLSGYWFNPLRHARGYYALGEHGGSACIREDFYKHIARCREQYGDALIVAFPHWGTDFSYALKNLRPMAESMILSGADMVIGHGPHTIAPIEYMHGKPVLYSVGNFVFNSNGWDFKRKKVPPYGLVVRLHLGDDALQMRLYPIYTYNLDTFWQPYPVTLEQFAEVSTFMGSKGGKISEGQDALGHYLKLRLKRK